MHFSPLFCGVFTENNQQFVMLPSGEMIPCIEETIVTDKAGEQPKVTLSLPCNIFPIRAEALAYYEGEGMRPFVSLD